MSPRLSSWLGSGLLVCALTALIVWHVQVWYLPRERPARLDPDSPVAQLLAASGYPVALWIPYPHQNLAMLDQAVGGGEVYAAAVARLAELRPLRLPAFGPFRVPPARELTMAASGSGERFAVFARVYAPFALFARLAGKLAGNPWLAGGETELSGRPVVVAWQGSVWTVVGGLPPELSETLAQELPPSLALLRVGRATGTLPAGLYRLERDGSSFEIRSQTALAESVHFEPAAFERLEGVLLVVSGRSDENAPAARSLAYFAPRGERFWEMPRVASLYQPGRNRYKLPGEELLKIAGREPRQAQAAGWSISALDRKSLKAAEVLAPDLAGLVSSGRLVRGVWLDPRGAYEEIGRIGAALEAIPLVPRRELERSRDAQEVLAPLAARFRWISLVVTDEPEALRLRLEAGESAVESQGLQEPEEDAP